MLRHEQGRRVTPAPLLKGTLEMNVPIESAHLEVTSRCNLRCKYCYNSVRLDMPDTDLSFESKKRLIEELIEAGCTTFVFSGGEPFSWPPFGDLLEWLDTCHPRISYRILTNGTLVTESIAKSLTSLKGAREIRLSIDGFSTKFSRGNGVYSRALRGALYLVQYGLKVGINTVLTKKNLDECQDFYHFLRDSGFDSWRIDTPFYCGAFIHNQKDLGIDNLDHLFAVYERLINESAKHYRDFRFAISRIWHTDVLKGKAFAAHELTEHPCAYHLHALTIRANGDVSFCPSWNRVFGNISNDGLASAWSNICNSDFGRLTIEALSSCKNCGYISFCGGGCRSDVVYSGNDLHAPDERTCKEMRYLFQNLVPRLPDGIQRIYRESIAGAEHGVA